MWRLISKELRGWLLLVLTGAAPAAAQDRLGAIEYFWYKDLDLAKIREVLPVREGGELSRQTEQQVRQAVAQAIGREPTDIAVICCDENGYRLLFIGLPGASHRSFLYHPEPRGKDRLPADIRKLYHRLDPALAEAVRRGNAGEDDSNGYALIEDPVARALQLAVRKWALAHEQELLRVLEFSSSAGHRQVAADALGYARQSREQTLALVRAARDPDAEVRNNATRALGVLVRSNAALASAIPPDTFISMLHSGLWTDRNKGASLLMELTARRDETLLAKLRSESLDALVEMASWRCPGHAFFARIVLGRVAGIPEDRLKDLAWNGPVNAILEAAGRR